MSSDGADPGAAIAARGVGKCYHIYDRPADRLKQSLWRGRRRLYREFWALKDVSFDLPSGGAVGILGQNGSGKSTLLQIIAGTLAPTEGEVRVTGRLGALLELGSGFNPEFTGRQNVLLQGLVIGLSMSEVRERFDDIAAFADIGEFMDQPVKTYSTGMFVRLAFAVQVQLQPDILVVDEALSVGDALFQKRCYEKLEQLLGEGVSFLLVSHDQEAIRTLTSHAVLLSEGRVHSAGSPGEVLLDYRRLLHERETHYYKTMLGGRHERAAAPDPAAPEKLEGEGAPKQIESELMRARSFGDFDAELVSVEMFDGDGNPASVFAPGDKMHVHVHTRVNRQMSHLNVFVRIRSKEGIKVYSWGTMNQDMAIWSGTERGEVFWDRSFESGDVVTVEFECECALGANFYEVQAGVAEEGSKEFGEQRILHWRDEAALFQVVVPWREHFFGGLCDMRMRAHVLD